MNVTLTFEVLGSLMLSFYNKILRIGREKRMSFFSWSLFRGGVKNLPNLPNLHKDSSKELLMGGKGQKS